MSVAMIIVYSGDDPDRQPGYIPLATESEFQRFWLPLARALDLGWIQMFATGVTLGLPDFAEVRTELDAIADAAAQSDLPPEAKAKLADRAHRARDALAGLDAHTVREVFVG